jgi:hypothetical protein
MASQAAMLAPSVTRLSWNDSDDLRAWAGRVQVG